MLNPDEQAIAIKGYLKKLLKVINEQARFTLLNSKIIDKKRIDDILCYIEKSFPQEYSDFLKRHGSKRLKSHSLYLQLLDAIKNRFLFSTSCYSVKYNEASGLIASMSVAIERDIRYIYSQESSMF